MHTAELRFRYRSDRVATIVAEAVDREIGEIDGRRAESALSRRDDELRIDVAADDLVALRASLNTWTTLLEVAERAAEAGTAEGL